ACLVTTVVHDHFIMYGYLSLWPEQHRELKTDDEGVSRMMKRLASVIALGLAGASVIVAPASTAHGADVDPANFVRTIDNPWYPLRPGTIFVFTGVADGKATRDVVTVTRQTKTILGVPCVVVKDNVYEAGKLSEATHDWYAQDKQGKVWYF